MEESPENGKESLHSAHANGMSELFVEICTWSLATPCVCISNMEVRLVAKQCRVLPLFNTSALASVHCTDLYFFTRCWLWCTTQLWMPWTVVGI